MQAALASPAFAVPPAGTHPLAARILDRLRAPPYYFVSHEPELVQDRDRMHAVLSELAPDQRLSFTRVRIDGDAATKQSRGTHYSRTSQPLAFHTDAAHAKRPHSLVAFAMRRPDRAGGGMSAVVCVHDVVRALSPDTLSHLREPLFDFGRGPMPILWGTPDAPSIRYYRTQLEERAAGDLPARPALDELDSTLSALFETRQFSLNRGDILFVNNQKALHARTGFAADSDRLMLRYRLRLAAIE